MLPFVMQGVTNASITFACQQWQKNVWSRIAQEKRVFELFLLKMNIPSLLTMIARSVHVGGNLWVKLTKILLTMSHFIVKMQLAVVNNCHFQLWG
jgi:hypothetical protein